MRKNLLMLVVIIITALACSKPDDGVDGVDGTNGIDGTNGTNGIDGIKGVDGINGIKGVDGKDGKDGIAGAVGATGSANVIYSDWKISPHVSRDTTIDGTCARVRHLNVPELTAEVLQNSVLLTYFRVGSIGPYALPYINDAGGATNQINAIYSLEKIFVFRHTFGTCRFSSAVAADFPGQPLMINLPQSLEYRYVIIPGAIKSAKKTQPNYSKMSYAEVCKLLNISE